MSTPSLHTTHICNSRQGEVCYRIKARCSNDYRAVWADSDSTCTASERAAGKVKHFYKAGPKMFTPPGKDESVNLCQYLKSMPNTLVAASECAA